MPIFFSQAGPLSSLGCTAEARLAFDTALDAFRYTYTSSGDIFFKTAGFLLLALGWLITSDRARAFLRDNIRARRTSLLVVLIAAAVHVLVVIGRGSASTTLGDFLNSTQCTSSRAYEAFLLGTGKVAGALFINLALATALCVFIAATNNSTQRRGRPLASRGSRHVDTRG
jgi:hypothetical protein